MLFQILTILFPDVLLPPMGLFHKPVNTKLCKPIVLSQYIQKDLCTQKRSRTVVTVLLSMKCDYDFKNQVGDVKPEEAATFKHVGKPFFA